jgi:hypothetical protein
MNAKWLRALLKTGVVYGLGAWAYVIADLFRSDWATAHYPLSVWLPVREDLFGVISFALSASCFFVLLVTSS